jgi:hypothetical protein
MHFPMREWDVELCRLWEQMKQLQTHVAVHWDLHKL